MDSKENKEKEEIKDEACPKPINPENQKDKNISKINKILSDNKTQEKVFDLLFVIDATGSMSSYITAAKDETKNISKELRNLYPEYNFQYGYVFYRDPIDSSGDKHEIINLTDQVNNLPEQIKKIKAYGGGDLPEDWVGAYKLVNEKINWRNGVKTIIHLADAGAHGKEFTLSDKYPEESDKLKAELLKCCQNNIKIFGYIITEDARNSFNQCQNYYRSNGGNYEICEFKIDEGYHSRPRKKKCKKEESDSDSVKCKKKVKCKKAESDSDSDSVKCKKKVKYKKEESDSDSIKCKKKVKYKKEESDSDNEEEDAKEEKKISSKQKFISSEFKNKVLNSVKYSIH